MKVKCIIMPPINVFKRDVTVGKIYTVEKEMSIMGISVPNPIPNRAYFLRDDTGQIFMYPKHFFEEVKPLTEIEKVRYN